VAPQSIFSDASATQLSRSSKTAVFDVDFSHRAKTRTHLQRSSANYDGLAIRSATKLTEKIRRRTKLKVIGRAGIGAHTSTGCRFETGCRS